WWWGWELDVSAPVVVVALHAPYITAHPIWSVPVVWHERWREGAPGSLAPAFCALNTARTKANTPASTRPNPASRATSTFRLRVTGICYSHNRRPPTTSRTLTRPPRDLYHGPRRIRGYAS